MDENDSTLKKKEKDNKIKREIGRLKKYFKDCDKNAMNFIKPLIENAAFMAVTLDDLQIEINKDGCTVEYKNGENQYGTKKNPSVETYNTMQKNYAALMKQIAEMIPKPEKWEQDDGDRKDDGFDEFVNDR